MCPEVSPTHPPVLSELLVLLSEWCLHLQTFPPTLEFKELTFNNLADTVWGLCWPIRPVVFWLTPAWPCLPADLQTLSVCLSVCLSASA